MGVKHLREKRKRYGGRIYAQIARYSREAKLLDHDRTLATRISSERSRILNTYSDPESRMLTSNNAAPIGRV
jgi:hypothetical protein